MAYAVALYFDDRTEALIKAIWDKLAEKGVSDRLTKKGNRPHLALAVFEDADTGELVHHLRAIAKDQVPVEARFEHLGTYCTADGVLFLTPVMSPRLFLLHSTTLKMLNPLATGMKESFRPNRYVPHCTIAYALEKEALGKAVALFSNKALPIVGQFTKIGLYDLKTNEDRCIYSFKKDQATS